MEVKIDVLLVEEMTGVLLEDNLGDDATDSVDIDALVEFVTLETVGCGVAAAVVGRDVLWCRVDVGIGKLLGCADDGIVDVVLIGAFDVGDDDTVVGELPFEEFARSCTSTVAFCSIFIAALN